VKSNSVAVALGALGIVFIIVAVLSGVAAYFSARFLLRYFRSGRLDPYGWYCIVAGLGSLALLHFNL